MKTIPRNPIVSAITAALTVACLNRVNSQGPQFRFELNPATLGFSQSNNGTSFMLPGSIHRFGDINADGFDDIAIYAGCSNGLAPQSVAAVFLFSGLNGSLLTILNQAPYCLASPDSIAGFDDLNGDSVPEVLIGRVGFPSGSLDAVSPVSGVIQRSYFPPSTFPSYSGFGAIIAVLDDVDIDGVRDIAVSRPYCYTCTYGPNVSWGAVDIVSGATGALIRSHIDPMPTGGQEFGSKVRDGGDLNGDGVGDVIVGSPRGHVVAFSGLTGSVIFQVAFPYVGPPGGANTVNHAQVMDLTAMGDVNGDGLGEFAISWGFPRWTCLAWQTPESTGRVWVVSGASQTVLYQIEGPLGFDSYGHSLDGSIDADGDGVRDLLVSAHGVAELSPPPPPNCNVTGFVDVVSGRTGTVAFRMFAPLGQVGGFAGTVRWIGDVNQDGFGDFSVAKFGGTTGNAAQVFTLPPIAPLPPAGGSVNRFGPGGTMDVLRFSHDLAPTPTAGGPGRCVVIPPQSNSIFVNMITPPGATSSPNYLLFGCVGTAFGLQPTTLPGGLGETIVPPAFLGLPNPPVPLFPIGDSGGWTGMQLPSLPVGASGTFVLSAPPPSIATTLTIQGLIEDPTEPVNGISTTNAVRLVIR